MSITTTNMGLVSWNAPTDFFNHVELAANWEAVDEHDHTTGKGVQIPAGGLGANAVATSNIANDAVTSAKIAGAPASALTAANAGALTSSDATVIGNIRTRVNELEDRLETLGLLP